MIGPVVSGSGTGDEQDAAIERIRQFAAGNAIAAQQIAALRDELADAYAEGANIGAVIGAHHARAAARSDDGGRS